MKNYDMSQKDMCNYNYDGMKQCIPQETYIDDVRLAAAYIPYQYMCDLFHPMEALKTGTAFPELFSPYDPKERKYRGPKTSGCM